jgi:hypothetical protein
MAGRDQAARLARRRGLVVLGSSAAAAAALSATRLIRQRASERVRRYEADRPPPAVPQMPPMPPVPLTPGLKGIYRQGRRALAQARKKPGDERWHELRERTKDLWHAAQLLEASRPKRTRKLVKRARRLSRLLGEDHDLAVLEQRLPQPSDQLAKGELKLIRRLIKRRRRKLQRQAEVLARSLYRRKPGRFVRRLGVR